MSTPARNPSVFVVDDDAAVRDSVCLLLETAGLPTEAYDGAEPFLAALEPGHSGCLVLDIRMAGMGGLDLQAELAHRRAGLPIIFLTAHGDIPITVRAMQAGAVDFLTKPVNGARLLACVGKALARDRLARQEAVVRDAARARLARLTVREREILALALAGHNNKQIARVLGISFRTVEVHRSRMLLKTAASTLLELSTLMLQGGFDLSKDRSPPEA